jgi:hypothetical protein
MVDATSLLANPMYGRMIKITVYGLIVMVLIAILGVIIWYSTSRRKYNYTCEIHEKRADSSFDKLENQNNPNYKGNAVDDISFDKGCYYFDKKMNTWRFRLQQHKLNIAPPDFKYVKRTSKGKLIYFRKIAADSIIPIMSFMDEGEVSELKMKIIDPAKKLWAQSEMIENMQVFGKPNWWDKFGPLISFSVLAILIIILIWVVLQKFSILSDVSNNLKEAAIALRQCR